jgi:suppressor of ftsI
MKKQTLLITLLSITGLLLLVLFGLYYWSPLLSTGPMPSMSGMTNGNTSTQHYPASNSSALGSRVEAKPSALVSLNDGAVYAMNISEIKKEINGKIVPLLAYNDSIPGPTIQVQQDSTIHIKLTNNLNMATTLHPHGLRTANAFDGVPDITQKPIQPGETFTYDLTFPDPGVYWYHPHLREDFTQDLGLAGNFLVVPKDTTYWNPVEHEWTALVDDILIDANHPQITANNKQVENALMGTYGNTMLVNGETKYQWQAKQGERARFYITNAANVRPFKLNLDGLKMKLVGADNGKYEQETRQEHIVLSPGERAVVETYFDQPGTFTLTHKTPTKTYQLASITVTANSVDTARKQAFEKLHSNPDIVASIDPFRGAFDKPIDKTLRLTMDMPGHSMMGGGMMQDMGTDGIEWEDSMSSMNSMMSTMSQWEIVDEATGKKNMDVQWQFQQGDRVKIKITNDKQGMHPMQHPVHLHGQRFLVLSQNGKLNTNLVWKDTVLVPAGDTVEVLVDMSNPGTWMLHCHISEHVENGMMMGFTVASKAK